MKKLKIIASAKARAHSAFNKAFAMAVYALKNAKRLTMKFSPDAGDVLSDDVPLPGSAGTVTVFMEKPGDLSLLSDSKHAFIRESDGVERTYTPCRYAAPSNFVFNGTKVSDGLAGAHFTLTGITGAMTFHWFDGSGAELKHRSIFAGPGSSVECVTTTSGGEFILGTSSYMALVNPRRGHHLAPPSMTVVIENVNGVPTKLEEWTFTTAAEPYTMTTGSTYSDGAQSTYSYAAAVQPTPLFIYYENNASRAVFESAVFTVRGTEKLGYKITKVVIHSGVLDLLSLLPDRVTHGHALFVSRLRWKDERFKALLMYNTQEFNPPYTDPYSTLGVAELEYVPGQGATASIYRRAYHAQLGAYANLAAAPGFIYYGCGNVSQEWDLDAPEPAFVYVVVNRRYGTITPNMPEGPTVSTGPYPGADLSASLYLYRSGSITQVSRYASMGGINFLASIGTRKNGSVVVLYVGDIGNRKGLCLYDELAGTTTTYDVFALSGMPPEATTYQFNPMRNLWNVFRFVSGLTGDNAVPSPRVLGEIDGQVVALIGVAAGSTSMLALYVGATCLTHTVYSGAKDVPRTAINVSTYEDDQHKLIFCHMPSGAAWDTPQMTIWQKQGSSYVKVYETDYSDELGYELATCLSTFLYVNAADEGFTATENARITTRLYEQVSVTVGDMPGKYTLKVLQWESSVSRYHSKLMMCVGFDASGALVPSMVKVLTGFTLSEQADNAAYYPDAVPPPAMLTAVARQP